MATVVLNDPTKATAKTLKPQYCPESKTLNNASEKNKTVVITLLKILINNDGQEIFSALRVRRSLGHV